MCLWCAVGALRFGFGLNPGRISGRGGGGICGGRCECEGVDVVSVQWLVDGLGGW